MGVPDLSALGARREAERPQIPPHESFYANDMGVAVNQDGSLAMTFRYAVARDAQSQPVVLAAKTVVMPIAVLVNLLDNLPQILGAAEQSMGAAHRQLRQLLGEVPEQAQQTGPSAEDLAAARRAAAGDEARG